MRVLIGTSRFALLLASRNASYRHMFALAREKVIPHRLGLAHPTHQSPLIAGIVFSILAVVVIVPFWIAGTEPYLDLFIPVNTPGIIEIVVPQMLCSLAAIGFFRADSRGVGRWQTLLAPALGAAGLLGALVLVLTDLEVLTGRTGGLNVPIALIAPAALALGVGLAFWLRARRLSIDSEIATVAVE